jgi:hypothetical protein
MPAMNACLLLLRRLASLLLLAAVLFTGSGCETAKKEENAVAKPLFFPVPKPRAGESGKGKWVTFPREGGTEHVQALGDMEDVISFYGFSHGVAPEVKSFDDMETLMRADNSLGFRALQRGDILGVPVLWFEKEATEKGAAEAMAKRLGVTPRQADGTYTVRTHGVFMFQPGPQPKFVTVACARTNAYGRIGPVYESQFRDWLTTIIENCFL